MKKIIVIVFLLKTINCQVSFLDQKFNPIFRLGRTAFNDFVKPSSFENGYRINLKNGVSFLSNYLIKLKALQYHQFIENAITIE